ncbi:MAG TPA: radical SAM protein [Gemmatimonadaceae bacterium]|nr:radical SAM protein [Gemmatimonadaceae bacterium]
MKIGFIAMSGVRVHSDELLRLGLNLPGFVERSKVIASLPSLGLLTLAGLTPPDIEVEYIEVAELDPAAPLRGGFDAVAISSFTAMIKDAYALADRYRAAGVTVILGGLHVTLVPDEAAHHADAIVIGEAEPLWPEVIRDLRAGQVRPRYQSLPGAFDLSLAPMPRFDLLEPSRYNRLTVQTQRGCPFNCEFCAASIRLRPGYRTKPVQKILAEIQEISRIWPEPFLEFADDNTFADKRHGRALVEALRPLGLKWFTESDVSVALDPELLRAMKASGCAQILVGFESPQAPALDGLEHSSNWKRKRLDEYRRAVDAIQGAGITLNGCFVLGLDGTDAGSFDAVYEFVKETGLYEVQITVMTPFPGTPLYRRLLAQGRIIEPGAWERCTLFDVNFIPERMTVEELERGFRDLMVRIYDRSFVSNRRRDFFRDLRARARRADASEPRVAPRSVA